MTTTTTNNNAKTETNRAGRGGKTRSTVSKNVAAMKEASSNGIIGHKVWWDLLGVDGITAELHESLKMMGCEACIPPTPTSEQRLRYAMERTRGKCGVDFKHAGRKNGWSTFKAVETKKSTDTTATAQHELSVDPKVVSSISVNIDDGAIDLGDPNCPVAAVVVKEYNRLATHFTSLDLSYAVVNVIESLNGARLRYYGGMYYVPNPADQGSLVKFTDPNGIDMMVPSAISALSDLVRSIGNCDFYVEEVGANSATARAAGNAAMRSLDGQYNDVLLSAEEFISTLEAGELVNGRSLSSRIKAVKSLRERAEMYSEILSDRGQRLEAAAKVVNGGLQKILDATAEVRALRKASGSDRAQKLASDMVTEIADSMKKALIEARESHTPIVTNDEKNN